MTQDTEKKVLTVKDMVGYGFSRDNILERIKRGELRNLGTRRKFLVGAKAFERWMEK